ncbi:hypothetical protein NC651_025633 [Populus alba x Populus x berolinensis]|nr:hypothetical protein NC651_025633 [Populus alba x Populus x berolinensis]
MFKSNVYRLQEKATEVTRPLWQPSLAAKTLKNSAPSSLASYMSACFADLYLSGVLHTCLSSVLLLTMLCANKCVEIGRFMETLTDPRYALWIHMNEEDGWETVSMINAPRAASFASRKHT